MKGRGSQPKTHNNSITSRSWGVLAILHSKMGYTIVEVMIFLAVSSALFAMIATSFYGRQASSEFSVAAREMESKLQDIANDVSTGYYNNPGNFSCTVPGAVPVITSGGNTQGTNDDCIFIGRVAQFDLDTSDKQYNLYSVVGARQASGEDVTNFTQAQPRVIAPPASTGIDLTETEQIPPGLVVRSMFAYDAVGNRERARAVGFFSTFGAGASGSSSSLSVNVIPLGLGGTGNSKPEIIAAINLINDAIPMNPAGGILICMDGDRSNQHALLKLGGNNRQLTTDMIIEGGTCASAGY